MEWWRTGAARHPARNSGTEPDRHAHQPRSMKVQRRRRRHQHHQAHGPDLCQHDLGRRDGHDQQVLDGAVLALADQRRAGEQDGHQVT